MYMTDSEEIRRERAYVIPEGTRLVGEEGDEYTVLSLLSNETGQANVYSVEKDGKVYALKLFFHRVSDPQNESVLTQIRILRARTAPSASFVTPLDIIEYDGRAGYIMEYVGSEFVDGVYLINGVGGNIQEQYPFVFKLSILHAIADAVRILFDAGLAIMDLKLDNIKFNPQTGEVRILDVDTIVANGARGFVIGTPGYMPPRVMRGEEAPDKYADCFALAVIIFETLFRFHPFEGIAEQDAPMDMDVAEYLYATHPVYVFHPADFSNRPLLGYEVYEVRYHRYPDFFTEALERTFVAGLEDKEERTTPAQWCEIIERLYESSFICAECGEEQFIERDEIAVCDMCGSTLVKPLLLQGDKWVPLYLGSEIGEDELWYGGTPGRKVFKIETTEYSGKFGITPLVSSLRILLEDGSVIPFDAGEKAPLILGARYLFEMRPELTLRQI